MNADHYDIYYLTDYFAMDNSTNNYMDNSKIKSMDNSRIIYVDNSTIP